MSLIVSKKPKLIFHSGLGNQLFQWAFFQVMLSKGTQISPAYVPALTSIDRPPQLYDLMKSQLLTLEKVSDFRYRSHSFLRKRFPSFGFSQTGFLDFRARPFDIPSEKEVRRASILTGYFQDFEYIQKHQEIVIPKLLNHIKKVPIPDLELQNSNVIHVRGGDLKDPENFKKYGILGLEYYETLPLDRNLNTIIVTDDLERAELIAARIQVDQVIGPDQLDPWQALRIMVDSRNLYAANSTLSLWASFLRSSQHVVSFVPNPIFRDPDFDHFGSLSVGETNLLSAKFESCSESH